MTSKFYKLEELHLHNCKNLCEGGIISFLSKIGEKLKCLDLGSNNLTLSNTDLMTSRFPELEEFLLISCVNLSETGVITFFNKIGESLKSLDLTSTNLSLSHVHLMTSSFPQLEDLILHDCPNLQEEGLISLLNKTGNRLTYVDIYLSEGVSGDIIRDLFPGVTLDVFA